MKKIIALFKNKIVILIIGIVTAIGIYGYYRSTLPQIYNTVPVVRGEVKEEVSVTGKVKPAQNLDIAFEKSGRLTHIRVAVGDKVKEGQTIMQLDNSDLYAQLAQAQANVRSQSAKLDQLKTGARPEDLAVSQAKVDNAKNALSDAERNLTNVTNKAAIDLANIYSSVPDTLTDAYTKSDDAIRNQVDALFINDNTYSPALSFSSFNSQARINAEASRARATGELSAFSKEVDAVRNANGNATVLDAAIDSAKTHLNIILEFFGYLQDVMNSPSGLDTSTLNTYKAAVSTARASIVAALANVNKQRQSIAAQQSTNQNTIDDAEAGITTAKNAINQAQRELTLKQAGSSTQDIAYQQSQLENARANVDYYQAQIDKTILKAPFAGMITKIVPTIGDIINPNVPIISIIGTGKFLIESYVAEADIAKIKVGNPAKVTLDAYGTDNVFDAKLIQIDISSTVLEGVATYKTTFEFTNEDSRILPGLTANIDIQSNQKKDVLYIPTRTIATEGERKYVKTLTNAKRGTVENRTITTGLRGSDGRTEIISGLREGESIITD